MTPGKVYNFRIDLASICIVFKPEHRMRLSITSSNFPNYARNQNTGNNIWEDPEIKIARNIVYHDKNHPSHIIPIKLRP